MPRRLPPLNALRAFEAAGRHLSFTLAAEELAVTQAAISHQIKGLEERLGRSLFVRRNRGLALTETGRAYLPALTQAFDLIDIATRRLARQESTRALKISVLPSFATKWLLPRLSRFRARHPEIDVLVSANHQLVDLLHNDIDVGIRFGRGDYPDLHVDRLMSDRKFPACSPQLLEGTHPLRTPGDLRHHTLLQDEVGEEIGELGWTGWLRLAGVTDLDPRRGPGFSDSAMVLSAAIAGQGVALARASLAGDDIAAGLLVKPFGPEVPTSLGYFLAIPPEAVELPRVRAFRQWILEEASCFAVTNGLESDGPPVHAAAASA